jgi:hypothetical protein
MRALALVLFVAAAPAHADISVDGRPRSPLGPACDAALAAAQERFRDGQPAIDFHVRERRIVGEYHWSDMCGVWGDYTIELAPDHRAPLGWQWISRTSGEPDSFHRRGTRRLNGWRARFIIDGDSDGYPGDAFVDAFRPAVEICLASASD